MIPAWSCPQAAIDHRRLMKVTGASILLMAIVGSTAYGVVHATLHIAGDPNATAAATTGKLDLVALAACAWLLVVLLDVIVSASIYLLYRRTNQWLAVASGGLRAAYAAILVFATLALWDSALSGQTSTAYLAFEQFESIWSIGLMVFGIHLCSLGYLVTKSAFTPSAVGWLLIGAGISYLMSKGGWLVGFDLADIKPILAVLMIVGELSFAVWLMARSIDSGERADPRDNDIDRRSVTFLQVFQSVLWAAAGIQKHENRVRDFSRGNPTHFILMGIAFTLSFVVGVVSVVHIIVLR